MKTSLRALLWLLVLHLGAPSLHAQRPAPPAKAAAPATDTPALRTSDGVQLYAHVVGRGQPCLFVHGGPGSGSYGFDMLAGPSLAGSFQMIYLDQRGSGRSAGDPKKDYSLARVVQDLEEVRQQLGLDKWVLMAHSFGGIIATEYARQHPDHVQGLILVNSILNLPASMESTVSHGYALLPAQGRPPLDPAQPLPQRWGMVMGLLSQQKLMSQLQYATDTAAARASQVVRSGPAGNREFMTEVFRYPDYLQDLTPASALLTMPVLVLAGQEDYTTGPEHYKSFRFPNQRVMMLPGRHNVYQESPAQFRQAVAAFAQQLAKKPAKSGKRGS